MMLHRHQAENIFKNGDVLVTNLETSEGNDIQMQDISSEDIPDEAQEVKRQRRGPRLQRSE